MKWKRSSPRSGGRGITDGVSPRYRKDGVARMRAKARSAIQPRALRGVTGTQVQRPGRRPRQHSPRIATDDARRPTSVAAASAAADPSHNRTPWSCASGSFSAVPPIESPSPPALFSWGRRCRRRMRGRFTRMSFARLPALSDQASVNRAYLVKRPPHPASPPSPPARNRGGRRALDEGSGKAREGTIPASV